MTSIGIDIIEIERIESAVQQWGKHFLDRIYTEAEITACRDRIPSLATRFAGKEAVMKVLGTGTRGINWREMELLADAQGKPVVQLYGKAREKARQLDFSELCISLSDTEQYAVAAAIGT